MVNSVLKISLETIFDASVLTLLYAVNNYSDLSDIVKLLTSVVILFIAILRLYFFVKDNIVKRNENGKIKDK